MSLSIHPLAPERWGDLEAVFGARGCGVARGCWCMFYRRATGTVGHGAWPPRETSRRELKALVDAGRFTGILAYDGDEPVGWLSYGPRADYARLATSRVMGPVDDAPVWSVICFVVPSAHRGRGIARALLDAAVAHAAHAGATLEAYPVDRAGRGPDSIWFGARPMFDRAGFVEVARRKPTRPVMRRYPDSRANA